MSGIIRSWNRGAEVIFGYAADEVLGRPIQLLFPPDRLGEEDLIVQQIRRGERVQHRETIRRRKDGSDFPVSVTISPIRDATGTIVGASKIVRDISERHAAQLALLRARDELEEVVRQRTKALDERNVLLREVYHRVKNNLQVVDGLVMLQALKISDPDAREALVGLSARIQALGLVHQQLMGSGDLATFDVSPFLQQLARNIADGAGDAGVTLSVDAATLNVDLDFAIPLGLLVTELVTNALKHAFPAGGGVVGVRFQPDGPGRASLTVSDDGVGLSATAPGAGLGSSLVKQLVAQMRGEVALESAGGTTTKITVPLPEFV